MNSISPAAQAQIDSLAKKIERLERQILSKNKEIPKKEWYRPSEICKLAGISRSKFEGLKRSGYITTHKLQGLVFVSHSELHKICTPTL